MSHHHAKAISLWALLLLLSSNAHAVPSFARQTGLECSSCHTVFPQLTPFGRQFKLGGYTLSDAEEGEKKPLPISAGVQLSYTSINKSGADVEANKLRIPQMASLYYAGKIFSNLGAFAQLAYEKERQQTTLTMADIRYANQATIGDKQLTYGLTLNNMPTLQDAWNSTPAYMFPYEPVAITPMPAAGLGLDMALSMKAVGLGAYTFWNNSIYVELSGYRSRDGGEMGPIQGVAPYWRLAYEKQWDNKSFSVGTYGMSGKVRLKDDMAMMMGDTTRYRDVALDAQYQYITEPHIFTLYGTLINRRQKYDMPAAMMGEPAMPVTDKLNIFRVNGSYFYQRRYGFTLGYFTLRGDEDPALYPMGEVTGSATGSTDSDGVVMELNYLPQMHTKLALQYTAYGKFNGARRDYDGFGRNASDNNTLYLLANFMF
ncbi:MAG: cytochrome C [Gammaproteobacteria bacterium]|nr:cytochrome C [Gammaproteobacteria bacterium]